MTGDVIELPTTAANLLAIDDDNRAGHRAGRGRGGGLR
jgi:hypothetical protein